MRDTVRSPTIETVAARAGVGRSTVSRVLNGAPRVSQSTRAAVERAIADLDYVPNHAARTLVTHRADTIALVLTGDEEHLIDPAEFIEFAHGIHQGLLGTAVSLRLCWARSPAEQAALGHRLAVEQTDGALLLLPSGDRGSLAALLARRGIPTVGGQPVRRSRPSNVDEYVVGLDHAAGIRSAVELLRADGRRTIAAIHPPGEAGRARLDGYRDALRAAGAELVPALVGVGDPTAEGGFAATQRLLSQHPGLDAVIAGSDLMAIGALRALRLAGRQVPSDVAVVGFGDSPVASSSDPPLTTIRQPVAEFGHQMARLLLARINGDATAPTSVVLATHVVRRKSAGA